MSQQVKKDKYNFSKYCQLERWSSYWHQLDEILKCNPKSVLEIGVGDKVVSSYLKNNTEINYTSVDIAADLRPDNVASVTAMPMRDNEFDLVCAFEVLEHLPFDQFKQALQEMKRVAKKDVILSLPHWGRHFSVEFRLPFFKKLKWQYKCNLFPIKHIFEGQHYWEIGKKGYSLRLVKKTIKQAGFKIEKDYVAFAMPYHHFFMLKK